MEINQVNSNYYTSGAQSATGTASAKQTTDEYIRGLEKKYGVHITIGKDGGFEDYMWGAGKGGNVYIPKKIADRMASDAEYAAKYEKLIAEQPDNDKYMQEYCDNHNMVLYGCGMQIHEDGKVTYWAIGGMKEPVENPGTVYKEKVQKQLEEKRAQKKKEKVRKEKAEKKKKEAEKLEQKREEKLEAEEKLREQFAVQAESQSELLNKAEAALEGASLAGEVAAEAGVGSKMDISI